MTSNPRAGEIGGPPQPIPAEVFARVPDALRRTGPRPAWFDSRPFTSAHSSWRDQIIEAYKAVTGGERSQLAYLSDNRARRPDVPRDVVDAELKRMHLEEGMTLMRPDNPRERTKDVRAGEVTFSGEPMSLLWISREPKRGTTPTQRVPREPEPIAATLTGRELGETPSFPELRDAAYRLFEDNFVKAGLVVRNEATGHGIEFSGVGLRKTTRVGEDLLPLVPALPDMLK